MIHNELFQLPAWKIARSVIAGEVSAIDVATSFLTRIKEINPKVRAWTHLNESYVIRQATRVLDTSCQGRLSGVPVGVKDIFNTEIFPTEMGSKVWKGHHAGNDARCLSYIRRDGGLIAGKTDTAEFAVHEAGEVLNPWGSGYTTGTSSGGSAVAVSTASVPISLATQTAGSTIRPASWCGVYGMKPSFGMIPRTGILKTTDTLDNIGFHARCNEDLRLSLDSLRVRGHNFPTMEKKLAEFGGLNKKVWSIGFLEGEYWAGAPQYLQTAMTKLATDIDSLSYARVEPVELRFDATSAKSLHARLYNSCLAYYFRQEVDKSPELISPRFMNLVEQGQKLSPKDYSSALREQTNFAKNLENLFEDKGYDFILHQSSDGAAPPGREPSEHNDYNLCWTLAWLPVISIPAFCSPQGLPYGFQIIGRRYSDYTMFKFLELLVSEGLAPPLALIPPLT